MKKLMLNAAMLACALLPMMTITGHAAEPERPFIWVKESDRPEIMAKIERQPWARSLFEELRVRADLVAASSLAERREKLMALPLVWPVVEGTAPTLVVFPREAPFANGRAEKATAITKGLQDGIDCGVMFYLTGEQQYAECAADILFTFINALSRMDVNRDYITNGGWLYQGDHLREVRIVSAQLPIIYDFIHPYLKEGGKVYDLASGQLRSFDFEAAQDVFRTYIWLALNHGLFDSNWPVLESPGLVHNMLALDDAAERAENLPFFLSIDTEQKFEFYSRGQSSLKRVARKFQNPGDVWPESLGYSSHVASALVYLMTLLDRLYPGLQLGERYSNIPAALTSYYDLRFPNGDTPYIGDGNRRMHVGFQTYEKALHLATLNGIEDQVDTFGDLLAANRVGGGYDRGVLAPRSYGWSPYLTPLQLLWSLEDPGGDQSTDAAPPHPRTNHLPHAGLYIQRNISEEQPIKDSLMAYVAGGSYIHGHASGMEMELYGQGHVLGINSGSSKYGTAVHENYHRLFAAKNTVISNGASASAGGWIGLGINTVASIAMEPALYASAVSPRHSFSTTGFHDEFNRVEPAHHQRTLALIRLTDSHGYYLDIFRARSDRADQFHDYLYHNVGDTLSISSDGEPLPMTVDADRYQASAESEWDNRGDDYQHPGWHYFDDVKTATPGNGPLEAQFTATGLGNEPVIMRALIPAGLTTELTRVTGPGSKGAPKPYVDKPLPAFVMRHQGETWRNPFVVVYESFGDQPSVQSVERLMSGGVFKGVKVTSTIDARDLTQYILLQENRDDTYVDAHTGLSFKGRFGLVTVDDQGVVLEVYIGDGSILSYKDITLTTDVNSRAAYLTR